MPLKSTDYTVATPPTAQDNAVLDTLATILSNAVESGYIDYWAATNHYEWVDVDSERLIPHPTLPEGRTFDAHVTVFEHNESDDPNEWGTLHQITPETLLGGVLGLVNGTIQGDTGYYDRSLAERLLDMLKDPKGDGNDDFDAADADIILQASILGSVVYG